MLRGFLFVICVHAAVSGYDTDFAEQFAEARQKVREQGNDNIRRTCSVWQAEGEPTGWYVISLDGDSEDGMPSFVFCDMSTSPASVVIRHDYEERHTFEGPLCNGHACHKTDTIIYSPMGISLRKIISTTRSCKQHIRYECYKSPLRETRWYTQGGQERAFWGGYPAGDYPAIRCGCYATGNCLRGGFCNCDANLPSWEVDEGELLVETPSAPVLELPVKEIGIGGLGHPMSKANITLGPAICIEAKNGCVLPPSVLNGNHTTNKFGYLKGDRIQYTCYRGFYISGPSSLVCGPNRQWSGGTPTCQKIDCGDPGPGTHANRQIGNTYFEDRVMYQCKNGYRQESGNRTRMCQENGLWSGLPLSCTRINCGDPGQGTSATRYGSSTHYTDIIRYSCVTGHVPRSGSSSITCRGDRSWSGSPLVCERINCGVPRSGQNSIRNYRDTRYGDRVTYTCSIGYTPQSGSTASTCQASGKWDSSPLMCTRVNCGTPPIDDTAPKVSGNTYYGDSMVFACIKAYVHSSGSKQITCTATGRWSGTPLSCKPGPVIFAATRISSTPSLGGIVTFDAFDVNIGDSYSPITGKFTVPFAGVYKFDLHVHSHGSQDVDFYITANEDRKRRAFTHPRRGGRHGTGGLDFASTSNSLTIRLSRGDPVYVWSTNGQANFDNGATSFSGQLLLVLEQ